MRDRFRVQSSGTVQTHVLCYQVIRWLDFGIEQRLDILLKVILGICEFGTFDNTPENGGQVTLHAPTSGKLTSSHHGF
jgi:hypothetical protein